MAALIISGLFLSVFIASKAINHFFPENIELSRKTAHILGGLVALSIPCFINNILIVALMCGGSFAFLVFMGIKKRSNFPYS